MRKFYLFSAMIMCLPSLFAGKLPSVDYSFSKENGKQTLEKKSDPKQSLLPTEYSPGTTVSEKTGITDNIIQKTPAVQKEQLRKENKKDKPRRSLKDKVKFKEAIFGHISIFIGVIGILFLFTPIFWLAFVCAGVAIVLGILGLIWDKKKNIALIGLLIGIAVCVLPFLLLYAALSTI